MDIDGPSYNNGATIHQWTYYADAISQLGESIKQLEDQGNQTKFYLDADKIVFRLSVSQDGDDSFPYTGHSWVEVMNTSATPLTMGHYTMALGEQITVGRFGNFIDEIQSYEYEGIWYNQESQMHHNKSRFGTFYRIETLIDPEQFNLISEYTRTTNPGYNVLSYNCVHYALTVWKMTADYEETNTYLDEEELTALIESSALQPDALEDILVEKGISGLTTLFKVTHFGYYSPTEEKFRYFTFGGE